MIEITASALKTAASCHMKYWLRYALKLRREREVSAPLRIGSAVHAGLAEYLRDHQLMAAAIAAGVNVLCPNWAEQPAWEVERETINALVEGHTIRWSGDVAAHVEPVLSAKLRTPSGRASTTFLLTGRVDALLETEAGISIRELKTTSESLDSGSDLWARLRADIQLGIYWLLVEALLGQPADEILYDVIRKPSIRLKQNETPFEFGDRLRTDIVERPDFYFARRQFVPLSDDIALLRSEIYAQAQNISVLRRSGPIALSPKGRVTRNVGPMTCPRCEYSGFCLEGRIPSVDPPPTGWRIATVENEELMEEGE